MQKVDLDNMFEIMRKHLPMTEFELFREMSKELKQLREESTVMKKLVVDICRLIGNTIEVE